MKRLLLAATAVVVAGPALAGVPVDIPFVARIAGAPFASADSYAGLDSAATKVQFLGFRLFVSSAGLIAADGTCVPVTPMGMNNAATTHSEGAAHGGHDGGMLHLGPTMCAASEATTRPSQACANPDRVAVELHDFVPGINTVVIDPAAVEAGPGVTQDTPETYAGCMSFPNHPDCNTVLPRLGVAFNALPAGKHWLVSMR